MAPATNLLAHVYSVPMLNIGKKNINTELKTGKKKKKTQLQKIGSKKLTTPKQTIYLDNKIKIRQFKYPSKGMGSQSQHPIISILSWHFSFANLFQSILHSKIKQTIMGF